MRIQSYADLDLADHIFLNLSEEINHIIQPLIRYFGLNSFNYHKTYLDNSQIRLTNTPEWCYEYLVDKYYQDSTFELPSQNYQKSRYVWFDIQTHHRILNGAKRHGINYGITFVEPVSDGCEFYFIGTFNDNPRVIDHCLSNFRLLEKFIATFHKRASELFMQITPQKVIVDDWHDNHSSYNPAKSIDYLKYLADVSEFSFTTRELDCVPYLLKGLSAKEIAIKLNISFRTVESHINNLKQKTDSTTKQKLLQILNCVFGY